MSTKQIREQKQPYSCLIAYIKILMNVRYDILWFKRYLKMIQRKRYINFVADRFYYSMEFLNIF